MAGATPNRPRRRLRDFGFAIASLIWILGAYFWWREFVPLRPTSDIAIPKLAQGTHTFRAAADGEIASMVWRGGSGKQAHYTGPVQFWSPRQGRLVRQFFDQRTGIFELSPRATLAAIQIGAIVRIVELRAGKTVFERKASEDGCFVRFSDDDNLVCFRSPDDSFAVCDATTGRELWSRRGDERPLLEPIGISHGLVHCLRRTAPEEDRSSPQSRLPPGSVWLNALTGQPDDRFGEYDSIRVSADEQRVIVRGPQAKNTVREFRTGKRVWMFHEDVIVHLCDFSADSRHVILPVAAGGLVHVAKWDAASGQVVTPLPSALYEPIPVRLSDCGRYLLYWKDSRPVKAPLRLHQLVASLGIVWSGNLVPPRRSLEVVNLDTRQALGEVVDGNQLGGVTAEGGFVIREDSRIAFYDLPPKKDLVWLVKWAVLPVAGLWMFVFYRRIRTKRPSPQGVASYNRL